MYASNKRISTTPDTFKRNSERVGGSLNNTVDGSTVKKPKSVKHALVEEEEDEILDLQDLNPPRRIQ
jgi:hypothetical protein